MNFFLFIDICFVVYEFRLIDFIFDRCIFKFLWIFVYRIYKKIFRFQEVYFGFKEKFYYILIWLINM